MQKYSERDYIICVNGYIHSNGSRVLHNLANHLEKNGYNVYMYSLYPRCEKYKYIDKISQKMRDNDIVIYPEIVFGNPLGFKRVARYILYYPGINGGDCKYHPAEMIFTYHRNFSDKGDILTVPYMDNNIFYKDNTPKTRNCYFVHKGGKWKNIPETDEITEINMKYPEKREDLGNLLRETKILYSYDDCSAILEEATLCGCEIKIIRENGFDDYKPTYEESIKDFDNQLKNFIEKTQNYKPENFEKSPFFKRPKLSIIWRYFYYKMIKKNKERALAFWWRLRGLL